MKIVIVGFYMRIFMYKVKDAFTTSEMLITVAVIGVMAAFLLPTIGSFAPDKNKSMFKKALDTTTEIVYEMVNDETIYPRTSKDGSLQYTGLENTEAAYYMGKKYVNSTKFASIFARKLSTNNDSLGPITSYASGYGYYSTPTVVGIDGIAWYLPNTSFCGAGNNCSTTITVDVVGKTSTKMVNTLLVLIRIFFISIYIIQD